MNRSLNTQHPIVAAYEPPQMTVVPIRASGAMLVGSEPAPSRYIGTMDLSSGGFYYEGQDGGTKNTATEWSSLDGSGDDYWGSDFF